ncbi:MAG: hypothetical protein DHS20C18_06310 [Saprospiraceae bacterium]|nr:MAG: hypothetical protein DHS20C18_06310 [Saprospiraceae bacterium]
MPLNERTHLPSKKYHYRDIDWAHLLYQEKVYVPIYSDIYHMSGERRFLLTATLSIRNSNLQDTMYVQTVEYYDSEGQLSKKYLNKTIALHPLESVEFVVENKEDQGGAGASFIVHWGTNSPVVKTVIQGVMIGTISQQGISFMTEGVVVEEWSEGSIEVSEDSTSVSEKMKNEK